MRKAVNRKENMESVAESFFFFVEYLLNGILIVYMLLILVVMPFYFTNGYASIGTDKANFFRQASLKTGMLLVPVFVIDIVFRTVVYFQKRKGAGEAATKKVLDTQGLWRFVKSRFSLTDGFVILFTVSLLLSYGFSDYKEQTLWGAQGWYIGLLPQLFGCILYFLISRAWRPGKWMVYLILPVSAVVFVLGYLNRFEIRPIQMTACNPGFISTIGNINWYCGYLVTVLFGGVMLLWKGEWERRWQKQLLVLYVGIGFASLVTQGSASGLFTLVIMLLVMVVLSAADGRSMQSFLGIMMILSLACLVTYVIRQLFPLQINFHDGLMDTFTNSWFVICLTIVSFLLWRAVSLLNILGKYPLKAGKGFARVVILLGLTALAGYFILLVINTCFPGKLPFLSGKAAFTFNESWGSSRGATWRAGAGCFGEQDLLHKLFGVGPDGMSAFLYDKGSEELKQLVKTVFGSAVLTNTHNEWLTVLVNEGVFGLFAYSGMICTAIVRYIRAGKTKLMAAFGGFCLLAYTINNVFSFQQSMNLATLFVIFGISEAFMRRN